MQYIKFNPSAALSSAVQCYWIFDHDYGSYHEERMIPDGYIDFVFHFGQLPRLQVDSKEIHKPSRFLGGHLVSPGILKFTGAFKAFGIRFFPWMSSVLYRMNANEMNNQRVPATELLGKSFARLQDLMMNELNEGNYPLAIQKLEQLLVKELPEENSATRILKFAIQKIFDLHGNISSHALAGEMGLGTRYLEKIFRERRGMSVKYFCRLARIQHAFTLIKKREVKNFTEVTYECDFYDQSHFIKDFEAFTGLVPSRFFSEDHMCLNEINNLSERSFFYKQA